MQSPQPVGIGRTMRPGDKHGELAKIVGSVSICFWEEGIWRKVSVVEVCMVGDEPTKLRDLVRTAGLVRSKHGGELSHASEGDTGCK